MNDTGIIKKSAALGVIGIALAGFAPITPTKRKRRKNPTLTVVNPVPPQTEGECEDWARSCFYDEEKGHMVEASCSPKKRQKELEESKRNVP